MFKQFILFDKEIKPFTRMADEIASLTQMRRHQEAVIDILADFSRHALKSGSQACLLCFLTE